MAPPGNKFGLEFLPRPRRLGFEKRKPPRRTTKGLFGVMRGSAPHFAMLLRFVHRAVDQLLELRERLSAAHVVAVDEERGGSADTDVGAGLVVRFDRRLVRVVVEGGLELVHVE